MHFRILGPLEVLEAGRTVALGGSKQRALLALLLLHANQTLTTDRLIDELWGERPPATAAKTLQMHVSRLRKALADGAGDGAVGDGPVVTRERGYEMRLDPERVDARRFERLIAEGRGELVAGRPLLAAAAFDRALSLWRGAPLADLAYEPFAQAEVARLGELRAGALEQLMEAKLALGLHGDVIAQLERLIAEYPYRERLRGQLMLALYRSERQADALQAYQAARRALVEDLGIEPGERLRELEQAILAQDAALAAQAPETGELQPGPGGGTAPDAVAAPGAAAVRLPDRLAEKVRLAGGSLEGERKQVTVLFVDIQGSMELAASVDAELWHALLDRFFAIVCEAVHRFEGTVDRFTGDGAMALFGAPIAHEDHARRACHAALRLRDALADYEQEVRRDHGLAFPVRMGLNSGEVVVGTVGEDLQMDYTAVGHTVGLAARMEQLAEPGRPLATEQTARLVDGFFELEDVGELEVKGAREPVRAYGLAGPGAAHTRLDAATTRGLSRFVGREREMSALEAALAHAGTGGQVVGVVAEAGLGKSRLCREFAARCRERGLRVTVGRGVAHGGGSPLLPVIEMLRAYFEVNRDDPAPARAKIASRLLAVDEALGEALPVLFDYLGVGDPERPVPTQMGPEARQRALFACTKRLLQAGAGEGPGVLVVEDLHWLDPVSEAFISNLVESLPGARTLLVVNFRPEYQADWMRRSYYQQLPLVPLERDAIGQLVHDLTGGDLSLNGLPDLIAERTGGNPFFVEEVIQALVERGRLVGERGAYRLANAIEEIEIPASVQALLAARIDRLPADDKALLQSAAVIGREFSEPVLRQVAGRSEGDLASSLAALVRAELVYERRLYPDVWYAFKHPLTQDVAYRSQLRAQRVRAHASTARALEELDSDATDELAALISDHWERANEALAAAQWAARAATWAGPRHADEGLRHWRRVRTLVGDRRDAPAAGLALAARVWIVYGGWRLGVPDDELELTYREALELAAASGDKLAMAMVRSAYGMARGTAGALEEAIPIAHESRRLAAEAGHLELEVSISPALWLHFAGRNREAVNDFERTIKTADGDLQLGRQLIGASAVVYATVFRGAALMEMGRLREAHAAAAEGLRLAREVNDFELVGTAHGLFGVLSLLTGAPDDGLAHAREGLALGDRLGSTLARVTVRLLLAAAHLACNQCDEANAVASDGLELIRESRSGMQAEDQLLSQLAMARLGLGDLAGARTAAAEGVALAARRGMRVHEALCRSALGTALLQDSPGEAKAELERAIELAGEDGALHVGPCLVALAAVAGIQGDEPARVRRLEEAHRVFEQQGATGHARRIAAHIAAAAA